MNYNDEKQWTLPGVWNAPGFAHADYQRKINKVMGVTPSGQSIVRLLWAWDCKKRLPCRWDDFGNAVEWEDRQKYCALTLPVPDSDDTTDISPPRWVLEERFEPGQYETAWEASRRLHDPVHCPKCQNRLVSIESESVSCVEIDIAGPAPRDGWYNALPYVGIVAEHDRKRRCCKRKWREDRQPCWGRYRVPDNRDLQALEKAIGLRQRDAEVNPHEALSPAALEQARVWGLQEMSTRKNALEESSREYWRDQISVHGGKLFNDYELALLRARGMQPRIREYFS